MSLEYVAEKVEMNPTYLGKIFKDNTGVYFSEYIINLRLAQAKKLLMDTNLNLTDISTQVGFNSTSYFATCFKKNVGMTPVKYRNMGG